MPFVIIVPYLCVVMYKWCSSLPDDSLTPHTLLPAVSSVRQFWRSNFNDEGLLQMLCVPQPVMDGIRASPSHSTEEEKDCWSTVLPPDSTWCIMGEDSWSIMEDGGAHSPGGSQTTSTSLWSVSGVILVSFAGVCSNLFRVPCLWTCYSTDILTYIVGSRQYLEKPISTLPTYVSTFVLFTFIIKFFHGNCSM